MDYFLVASAFGFLAGALFVASVLTASFFALCSALCGAAGAVTAGAVATGAVAGVLAGSAANAVAANKVAIKVDTSFMDISLV
jgi:hypothetical protein